MSCGIIKEGKTSGAKQKTLYFDGVYSRNIQGNYGNRKNYAGSMDTVKHVHKWRNYAVHKKYKVLKQLLCFWQGAVFGWIKAWIS